MQRKIRVDELVKWIDDETVSMQEVLDHSFDYYQAKGKTDYGVSADAAYLRGRIDSLQSVKRSLLPRPLTD